MASTYSSNLRLELIASGQQANTWGNTTNTNLGTLLEQAITGITDVDISSGDVTLTALNGAYDQSRGAILSVTGSSGSTRTIFTQANVSKVYIVDNASTVDVILKTLASGTPVGVTIPAGTAKLIYTDGTDYYEGSNAASIFTADTVTITGTPTAPTDAITKAYANSNYLPLAGGTMAGAINMGTTNKITNLATPTSSTDAATKGYVDGAYVPLAGGTMTGPLVLNANPTVALGAVTKQYADSLVTGSGFASGTTLLFYQAAAPTGWTQVTTQNNKALRVVSTTGGGSGGSVAFTTAFASQTPAGTVSLSGSIGFYTLSTSEIPPHTHSLSFPTSQYVGDVGTGGNITPVGGTTLQSNRIFPSATGSAGGGAAHNHSFGGTATFSGSPINLAVQYIDIILCSKN